ncbi:MAG: hypothetical protein IJX87_04240 [Clostridia bacterium]|nr:hypothetical protein [Clostridia bacterium]
MMKKKILYIGIVAAFLAAVVVCLICFLANMIGLQNELKQCRNADRVYITYETRNADSMKELKKKEFEKSEQVMYYAKRNNGEYDLRCGNMGIYGDRYYHDTIGPYSSGGSQAEIRAAESAEEYKAYFQTYEKTPEKMPFNLSFLLKHLQKHQTLFTSREHKGKDIVYTFHTGERFYRKLCYGENVVQYNNCRSYPVTVTVTDGKLSKLSFTIDVKVRGYYFFPYMTSYTANSITQYNVYFDYQTVWQPTNEQNGYPYQFYKTYQAETCAEILGEYDATYLQTISGGKLYAIVWDQQEQKEYFRIYDLKTGEKLAETETPDVWNGYEEIVVKDGEAYVVLAYTLGENGVAEAGKIVKYISAENAWETYDIDAYQMAFADGQIIVLTKEDGIYSGNDLSSLAKTDRYPNCNTSLYYDNNSGNTYATQNTDGKSWLVKLTKDGVSQTAKLPFVGLLSFNAQGVVLGQTQYDFDLNFVKSYEVDIEKEESDVNTLLQYAVFTGDFLEETERFCFYKGFVYDKTEKRFYACSSLSNTHGVKYEGEFYYIYYGVIYGTKTYTLKNAYP